MSELQTISIEEVMRERREREDLVLTIAVTRLKALSRLPRDSQHRWAEARLVGHALHDMGGERLMLEALYEANNAFWLDKVWHGIGGWLA